LMRSPQPTVVGINVCVVGEAWTQGAMRKPPKERATAPANTAAVPRRVSGEMARRSDFSGRESVGSFISKTSLLENLARI
jgi:hypothetical protein